MQSDYHSIAVPGRTAIECNEKVDELSHASDAVTNDALKCC